LWEKRATGVPSAATRNFSKFQEMSPVSPLCLGTSHSSAYTGCRCSPLTSTFSVIGNVTPYVEEQKAAISSEVPGS
jgi:hypothetical protein